MLRRTVTPLFLNVTGERLRMQGMAKAIAELRQDAEIERHVTPHMRIRLFG